MRFLKRWNDQSLYIGKLCLIVILCVCCIGLAKVAMAATDSSTDELSDAANAAETFLITDLDQSDQMTDPITVDLSKSDEVIIDAAGEYLLTGSGSHTIIIDAQDQIVHLFLGGMEVRTNCGPALLVKSAGKLIITVMDGSMNTLRDAGSYTGYEDYDAAIYSQTDITMNGNGVLNIYGYHEDAIHTKDIFKLLDGQIYIQAKQDGIKGNDGVLIKSDELTIESEKYGIRTTKNGKQHKGDIDICGGNVSIIAGQNAIVSGANLYVRDSSLYCKSVVSDMDIAGKKYIDEECYTNE